MKYQIQVDPTPFYVTEHSQPEHELYTFAYHIQITNTGEIGAKLQTRHWLIIDGNGKKEEVFGAGVIGETPHLAPGESFEYTSGAQLKTAAGTMEGSYQFVADDGVAFDAEIPQFILTATRVLH